MLPFQRIEQNPRDEGFLDMFHSTFCPKFSYRSFSFFIGIAITTFYFIGLIQCPSQKLFLSIENDYLITLGAIVPIKLAQFEVWRLITSCFIVSDLFSYCLLMLLSISMCSQMEQLVQNQPQATQHLGSKVVVICWLIPGFEGGISQSYFSQPQMIISSIQYSLMGVIAILLGFFILNYERFREAGSMICCLVVMIILMVMIGKDNSVIIGNISSILMGIFLTLFLIPPLDQGEYQQKCKQIGLYATISLTIITFCAFYFLYKVK